MIIIYTKSTCNFCTRAKDLLNKHDVYYVEINVDKTASARDFLKEEGHYRVPQIYSDGKSIGGFNELSSLQERKWKELINAGR